MRVPWLLDAESGQQIDTLEDRAQTAESKLDGVAKIEAEAKRLHSDFGVFMEEGETLAQELRRGMENYGPWAVRRNEWVERVSRTLTKMGLPTEASAFRGAGEEDFIPAPGTVFDRKHQFQLYMSQLKVLERNCKRL